VVGLPHPDWGQRPVAFVVPSGATIDELVAHCAANLAAYKCPDTIHFVDALPRTAAGKLQRHLLREQVPPDEPA
jgi:acyl-CoA synthetase (AMP-forming)/AMP-acid ligase II